MTQHLLRVRLQPLGEPFYDRWYFCADQAESEQHLVNYNEKGNFKKGTTLQTDFYYAGETRYETLSELGDIPLVMLAWLMKNMGDPI